MRRAPGSRPSRATPATLAALVAALTLGVGSLTGCGGEASADASSPAIAKSDIDRIASAAASARSASAASEMAGSSSAAAATSGSPGVSSPTAATDFVVPEAAKAHTQEGAKAFVRFYWDVLGRLDARPQTGIIERYSDVNCKACQMQIAAGKDLIARNAHIQTGTAALTAVRVREDSTADSVVVQYHETARDRKELQGGYVKALGDVNQDAAVLVVWREGAWKVGECGTK